MEKINLVELLKDCPQGMELDCTLFEGLEFDSIVDNEYLPIRCRIKNPDGGYSVCNFTKHGCWTDTTFAKCVIFPKGKTTWEGFHRPFEDGDILAIGDTVYIYNGVDELSPFPTHYVYVIADKNGLFAINTSTKKYGTRFATEEEKHKLFQAIKDNGYRWNAETKTLEKLIEPYFKMGDRIRRKNNITIIKTIGYIYSDSYALYDGHLLYFKEQDEWELVPNKFDISTLKPFDKVLIRDINIQEWRISLFSHCNGLEIYKYSCINGSGYAQCIPYKGNEHLLGTTKDCDNYYKT